MQGIKIIVFDLDGTLVDTMSAFADIAAGLMTQVYGMNQERARLEYLRTSGIPFFKQLNIIFPGDERNAEVAAQFEMNKLDVRKLNKVDDETRVALSKLTEQYKLAISSNNYEQNVIEFARNEDLRFDFCLGFKTGLSSKGKKHFQFLCDTLGITPAEILFIGDALHDARIAAECGVNFMAKLGTFAENDFKKINPAVACLNKVSELHHLLQQSPKY